LATFVDDRLTAEARGLGSSAADAAAYQKDATKMAQTVSRIGMILDDRSKPDVIFFN
jgi:hypothetical protein